ncbi:MAG: CBS domain-containing protein [Candidatus Saccharibacteria bacterium]
MKVNEAMHAPVITVTPHNSLQETLEIMRDNNLRRLPVLEGNELVGIIVQHDIEKALRRPGTIYESPVDWVMTKTPIYTIEPGASIVEAARMMKDLKISAIPVVEAERLVGIISDTDILEIFISIMERDK